MKIGIFGDSFAARPGYVHLPSDKTFWSDVIGKVHEVENYAKAGTNLYWSFNLLKENYHKFDVIILVVTGFGRCYTPNAEHHTVKHAFNLAQIQGLITNGGHGSDGPYSEHDLKILHTLRDYKLYVEDDLQSALFHELLLEKIKSIVPNIILIPSWKGCLDPLKEVHGIDVGYDALIDISTLDIDYCKISFNDVMFDKRFGHLSPINNLLLGKDLLAYLDSDRKNPYTIDLSKYKSPSPMSKEEFLKEYFILR
jgi:hypothetical protein